MGKLYDDERPLTEWCTNTPWGQAPDDDPYFWKTGRQSHYYCQEREAIIRVSNLPGGNKLRFFRLSMNYRIRYYRFAVAEANHTGTGFPKSSNSFHSASKACWHFTIPKQNIPVFRAFDEAGIEVKIITGDNMATTRTIAMQTGFKGASAAVDGGELHALSDDD